MTSQEAKRAFRARVRAARARRTPQQRAADTEALCGLAGSCEAATIAAFVPLRDEPGDLSVIDALRAGRRLLLPVTGESGSALQWGWYDGAESLVAGPLGLLQPAIDPSLGPSVADLVLVPALALSRTGYRLGQGGGFYDRSMRDVPTDRLAGVVHDDEVFDAVPAEPHDLPVGWICTPSGIRRAGA